MPAIRTLPPGRPQVPGTEKAPQTQVLQLQKRGRKGGGKAEDAGPEIPKGAALTGSLDGQSSPSSYSQGHGVSPGMSAEQERAKCLFPSPGRQRGVPPTDHLTGRGEHYGERAQKSSLCGAWHSVLGTLVSLDACLSPSLGTAAQRGRSVRDQHGGLGHGLKWQSQNQTLRDLGGKK